MQHEGFFVGTLQRLSMNCSSSPVPSVATTSRLGFTAGEERRPMGAGQGCQLRKRSDEPFSGHGHRCG